MAESLHDLGLGGERSGSMRSVATLPWLEPKYGTEVTRHGEMKSDRADRIRKEGVRRYTMDWERRFLLASEWGSTYVDSPAYTLLSKGCHVNLLENSPLLLLKNVLDVIGSSSWPMTVMLWLRLHTVHDLV
jgi:hypothetical protein